MDVHGALTAKIAMQASLALLREETSSALNWKWTSFADVYVIPKRTQIIKPGRDRKSCIVTELLRVLMGKVNGQVLQGIDYRAVKKEF